MDRADFDSRYQELVSGQIENFGKKEVTLPDIGRVGCSQVIVELPPESVAALEAIAQRDGSLSEATALIRIAGGLRQDEALRSELSTLGTGVLND